MNKIILLFLGVIIFTSGQFTAASASQFMALFDDQFGGSSIDLTQWNVITRAGSGQGTRKEELQFYSQDAVAVREGMLHLSLGKKDVQDPQSHKIFHYEGGRIESKRAYLYGLFQMTAKLPKGRGLWPALWLRTPTNVSLNGEIDIIEGYGSHPNLVQSTLHPWVNGKENTQYCAWLFALPEPDSPRFHRSDCQRINTKFPLSKDLSAEFHTYGIDWQSDHITWYFDRTPYFTVKNNISQVPMVMVLYLAISPNWDGPPEDAALPQTMEVKRVSVNTTGDISKLGD